MTVFRIGLISDTHGVLRPEATAFLRGSDHIIHAGDICDPAVLQALEATAPVTAVLGNNDRRPWTHKLHASALVELAGVRVYVIHDLATLDIDPRAAGVHVVVSGHSHKPSVTHREGVLYVNPGSAGPRRFKLPIAAAELLVHAGSVSARIAEFSNNAAANPSEEKRSTIKGRTTRP